MPIELLARALADQHVDGIHFETYFDKSPDCMFHLRVEEASRFVYDAVNQTALASTGLTRGELLGRTPEDVLGPDKGAMMASGLRQVCASGKAYRYEPTWQLPGGTVTFDAVYMPQHNADGDVVGILGIARDITKQRQLEAVLQQTRKMEALGQLTSGVAHDFNNLLAGFQACFKMLTREINGENGQQFIAEGMRTVARGKALTDRMLAFARKQTVTAELFDLNGVINNFSDILYRTLSGKVSITRFLAPGLWPIVLNLAINARDAMPSGGSLSIETRNEVIGSDRPLRLAPGDYVSLSVKDSGSGMPPHVVERALEPFFTTKAPGEGTGLGLSVIHGMVTQMGGAIEIVSAPRVGTCVTLYFPRAQGGVIATRLNGEPG
jgi:PAS domain S-box-containing protein